VGSPQGPDTVAIVRAAADAYVAGAWERFGELVHPDAQFDILSGGGRTVQGRARVLEALSSPDNDVRVEPDEFRQVRPDTVLVTGKAGTPGHALAPRFAWLVEVRDGCLWRIRVFASAEEALAAPRLR
jgi:ketosteroid isomerase-like protein